MSLNLYTYCANNPIIYNDPDGHSFKLLSNLGKSLYNFGKKAVNTIVNTSKSIINKANNVRVSFANTVAKTWNSIKTSYVGIKEKVKNVVSTPKKTETVKADSGGSSYLGKSVNQVVLGNYTEDVTLLGTGVQVATGIAGVDLPMDIRDISADFVKWEWSWGHARKTAVDLIAVLPIVGVLKYGDEAASIVKNSDEALSVFKKSDNAIKGVGKGELHHIASDKSLVSGFTAQYEKIFKNAGMNLQNDANLIFLEGHSGAHTKVYKQYVLDYVTNATKGLKGDVAKEALTKALTDLKDQLIKNPKMPYKGGL